MPHTVIRLFEEARAKRELAERARRLAAAVATPDVADNLLRYAAELDDTAREREEEASRQAEQIVVSEQLCERLRAKVDSQRSPSHPPSP